MENLNNNKKMFFSPDLSNAVAELLKKYALKETTDIFLQKMEKDEPTNGKIINLAAQDFADGIISKSDIINLLQQKLSIEKNIGKKITEDIIEKIVPIMANFQPPEEIEEYTETETIDTQNEIIEKLKPPIGSFPNQGQEKKQPIIQPEKKEVMTEKQQDSYREPIE